jgi:hypothetical protein
MVGRRSACGGHPRFRNHDGATQSMLTQCTRTMSAIKYTSVLCIRTARRWGCSIVPPWAGPVRSGPGYFHLARQAMSGARERPPKYAKLLDVLGVVFLLVFLFAGTVRYGSQAHVAGCPEVPHTLKTL